MMGRCGKEAESNPSRPTIALEIRTPNGNNTCDSGYPPRVGLVGRPGNGSQHQQQVAMNGCFLVPGA